MTSSTGRAPITGGTRRRLAGDLAGGAQPRGAPGDPADNPEAEDKPALRFAAICCSCNQAPRAG